MVLDLNGKWDIKTSNGLAFKGTVPGTFFYELEKSGYWEGGNVFYRENNRKCDGLASQDVVYSRDFKIDKAFAAEGRRCFLSAEGLDTLCTIKINNKVLTKTNNMHIHHILDVTKFLKEGNNSIQLEFADTIKEAAKLDAKRHIWSTNETVPGSNQIRKNFCSYGWDWGPSIPDMGIWRPVSIVSFEGARLTDLRITQKHAGGKVTVTAAAETEQWSEKNAEYEFSLTGPDGKLLETKKAASPGISFKITNPELWWPNNLGKQPLYKISVRLLHDDKEIDSRELKIGLRTLVLERKKDKWGESFGFCVNGQTIFAVGANFIPQDVYLTRADRDVTRKLLESCINANFNCLRVWGGGIYPDNSFYELCDEMGLVVWQDMMFACALYPGSDDSFIENISMEIEDNLKRIRHHASLGLLCGNNEMEWAFTDWPRMVWNEKSRAEYVRQYEFVIPAIAAKVCPEISYWKASPSSGGFFDNPNGDDKGDVHFWNVWHGGAPYTEFRKHHFRFLSEYGFQSFPSFKTIKTFCSKEDLNLYSPVMEDHQRNGDGAGNQKIMKYAGEYFRLGKSLENNIYISQISQAEAGRYAVEHMRQNRERCLGSTYWQLNDNWPVTSWSSIDYFGRWKALHYAMKTAYDPVLLSCREEGTGAEIWLSNESAQVVKGSVSWQLMDFGGKAIRSGKSAATVKSFFSVKVSATDFSKELKGKERQLYLSVTFRSKDGLVRKSRAVFEKYKKLELSEPVLKFRIDAKNRKIRISAEKFAKFVMADFGRADAVFSDNFFDLDPGETREITYDSDLSPAHIKSFSVISLRDTY